MGKTGLTRHKKIHMIGIKGAGMTALAELLVREGVTVTGSDTTEVFFTDAVLKRLGLPVIEGFAPENIPADAAAIIYSSSYTRERNPELEAAFRKKKPIFSYAEALGLLSQERLTLAVCGTHGKTTTSALLAQTLKICGADPSAIVGGRIIGWEGNALSGSGDYLVIEADEYQDKLAQYSPYGVILTSVDWDHPDFFPDAARYRAVFEAFVARIPRHGTLVFCSDSAAVCRIADQTLCRKISYGALEGADFRVTDYTSQVPEETGGTLPARQRFTVTDPQGGQTVYTLRLAGRHNALNATAVIALASFLKLDREAVRAAIEEFAGTERRFEFLGERFGTLIYDDYAHHPEEIRVTLRAFRELYPQRTLRVVFHPHTFTRTKAYLEEFAQSFEDADHVSVLDIYGSAREEQGGVSSVDLVNLINRYQHGKAEYAPVASDLIATLEKTMGRNDVIVTLGAGNVWEISHALAHRTGS